MEGDERWSGRMSCTVVLRCFAVLPVISGFASKSTATRRIDSEVPQH